MNSWRNVFRLQVQLRAIVDAMDLNTDLAVEDTPEMFCQATLEDWDPLEDADKRALWIKRIYR